MEKFKWHIGEPPKSGEYLVTTNRGVVSKAKYGYGLYKAGEWEGRFKNCVIAWAYLPKPYAARRITSPEHVAKINSKIERR